MQGVVIWWQFNYRQKKICGHELGTRLIYYYKKNAHQTLMQLIYKSESYRQQRKLHCSFVRTTYIAENPTHVRCTYENSLWMNRPVKWPFSKKSPRMIHNFEPLCFDVSIGIITHELTCQNSSLKKYPSNYHQPNSRTGISGNEIERADTLCENACMPRL